MMSNHPFRDGNKRTAVVLLYAFLRANGHDLTLTDTDLFELAIGAAEHRLTEDQVDSTIRSALTGYATSE
jgi:death-on-curing protein